MNLMLIFMFVMILGLVRLMVWGAIHKRFPVSTAYPITALFFPCLLILAWLYGEHISLIQITGASLVVAGVVILLWRPARESLEKSELL
ncbi:MAG: hypothetical protein EPN34_06075 [Burkholderiaceae bacterium]|nr:MAG: hypothetical protein EPN34_06075 [Burkholderiaceae bacterium]